MTHTDSEALRPPKPGQSRREFCVHACQALSLVTVGAVLEACGGSGSPTGPSSLAAQALPVINANVSNNTVALTIDSSSPLSSVGSAALVQTSAGSFLVAHVAQDSFTALTADLHAPDVLHHRVHERDLRVPLSRIAVQHERQRDPGTGGRAAAPVLDARYANGVLSVAF